MEKYKYKQLGRTGIKVFPLGFGGHPIQKLSEEKAVKVVKNAIQKGINFIDTSPTYADSQKKVGIALNDIDRKIYLASQTGADDKKGALNDVKNSLKLLGVNKIDIFQLHAITTQERYNKRLGPGGALEGLIKAREEGLIDYIGITSHKNDGDLLVKAIRTNKFDTVMFLHNFMEYDCERQLLQVARELDIGMIALQPMAGGRLDDASVALKYILKQDDVVPICGMMSTEEVEENIKIAMGSWEYTANELERKKKIEAEVDRYFCRRCDRCLPCPQGIPISVSLRAESFIKRIIPRNLQKGGNYHNAFQIAKACNECGVCLDRCPNNLDIPNLIKKNIKIMDSYLKSLDSKL